MHALDLSSSLQVYSSHYKLNVVCFSIQFCDIVAADDLIRVEVNKKCTEELSLTACRQATMLDEYVACAYCQRYLFDRTTTFPELSGIFSC